jgi:hypothetical protein
LFLPAHRQRLHQLLQPDAGAELAGEDRLDKCRRQLGRAQEAGDVALADPLGGGSSPIKA